MIARNAGFTTVTERVTPPFDDTHPAVNPVNTLPLFPFGVYATRNCPANGRVTPVNVGAGGDPTITAPDGTDATPVPTTFVARTVHVYDRPVVAPATVIGDPAPDPVRATPPFDDTHDTPNDVIGRPPALPAENDTTNGPVADVVDPDLATTPVGAPGTVAGTTAADGEDAGP